MDLTPALYSGTLLRHFTPALYSGPPALYSPLLRPHRLELTPALYSDPIDSWYNDNKSP